ncbi:MAG TPA: prolyl oligopeptidase family serine peptidase [Thermoleophilaceae bacterium]|nr:prolyl oligopeptidase family serine peptidase [Thermoleophilaceae bacterium]
MLTRSIRLAPLLLFLLAGACGQPAEPPVGGPDEACTVPTVNDAPAPASALAAFAYDRAAAYDPVLQPVGTQPGVAIYALSFLSPRGTGRATGLLFVPEGAGPFAGLLLQHGLPGNAQQMTGEAVVLARQGAVVVALDAPFARRGGSPVRFTAADSAEQVQLMTDLQRAVDLLVARPDVDASRIGYMGVSYGGAMGALFVGIERRLRTGILVVADGGLVSHFTGPEDGGGPVDGLPCAQRQRWLESMIPIEPIKYVGFAPPTPLLLQSGRQDNLVPPRAAELLHAAVRDPRTIRWYEAGHGLTAEAARDRLLWLQQSLGMRAPAS